MRPGQNKRMRGRNNNGGGNRKGPNPLTRSYESNGPDVKIRGTAQHIGEKYLQLARDAQTSGDPVAAESYLQHAEHYFRLIAAAQQAQYQAQNGLARTNGDGDADDGDDDDDLVAPDRFALPSERMQPQPAVPAQQNFGERPNGGQERQDGQDRPYRQEGQDRQQGQPNYDRGQDRGQFRNDRQDRYNYDQRNAQDRSQGQPNYGNGQDRGQDRGQFRNDRPDRNDRNANRPRYGRDEYKDNREAPRDNRDMQFRDQPRLPIPRDQPVETRPQPPAPALDAGSDLPAFITAPVRTAPPPAEPVRVEDAAPAPDPIDAGADASEQLALRPRRRRRSRVVTANEFDAGETPPSAPSSED